MDAFWAMPTYAEVPHTHPDGFPVREHCPHERGSTMAMTRQSVKSDNNNPQAVAERKARFNAYCETVKRSAYGNWDSIFMALAGQGLTKAIEAGPMKHVHCPVHGGSNGDAFRLMNDYRLTGGTVCNTCGMRPDGFATLMWLFGWDFVQTVKEVGESIGQSYGNGYRPATANKVAKVLEFKEPKTVDPKQIAQRDERRAADMAKCWSEGVPIFDERASIARAYLKGRGFMRAVGPLDDIRFHADLPYWENNVKIGSYPTMLRLLRQANGDPLTIERLYLTPEGKKADVDKQKKIMPYRSSSEYHGSCVRLDHDVGTVLCVTEGVETGLAFRGMFGLPTWSTTVAGLMETLVIPASVEILIIAADKDPETLDGDGKNVPGRGELAATVLQKRVRDAKRKATVFVPPYDIRGASKMDWADVVEMHGFDNARNMPYVAELRDKLADMLDEMGYQWDSARAHY